MISDLFKPPLIRHAFLAMGTEITVTLALKHRFQRKRAKRIVAELRDRLRAFGHDGWAWGSGALARFNQQLAGGGAVEIPPNLRTLFSRGWQIRQSSDGLFEPRIASLVHLWGFDDPARLRSSPPAADEVLRLLDALRRAPAYAESSALYGPAPDVGWDFGGLAKGYIVDLALEWLHQQGFANATVDAGGNLAARGRRHSRSWRIGIRRPLLEGDDVDSPVLLATLSVGDESVNTHGDDQRFFIHENRRYSHILDPRTGQPLQHGLRSLTVVHHDGTLAEGVGAAMFVAGPGEWPELARRFGIDQVMAVHADGRIEATPALASRLQPEPGVRIELSR